MIVTSFQKLEIAPGTISYVLLFPGHPDFTNLSASVPIEQIYRFTVRDAN